MAWLQDVSGEVTNQFTPTTIDVDLQEQNKGPFQIIPGVDITKDPIVTASASDNVDYFVFVEVTETGWINETETVEGKTVRKVNYEIDPSWTLLGTINNGATKVYYQEVADGAAFSDSVLKDNKVTVSSALTKEEMAGDAPELKFKAYTIQKNAMQASGNKTVAHVAYETVSSQTLTAASAN